MTRRHWTTLVAITGAAFAGLLVACDGAPPPAKAQSGEFPAGYVDSPYVLPDGRTIYFLASPSAVNRFGQPKSPPATAPLPGHQAIGTDLWFNTDLYVSRRRGDGLWSVPTNLGPKINSPDLECCIWVSDDARRMIFSRDGVFDKSRSGNFLASRPSRDAPWGTPQRLEGSVGRYLLPGGRGIHDLHPGPVTGGLYGWSDTEKGKVFFIPRLGPSLAGPYGEPSVIDLKTPKGWHDSQPWISGDETRMVFNRWQEAERELWQVRRNSVTAPWGTPEKLALTDFADPNGLAVWGEPSFDRAGNLYFTRFNTASPNWDSALLLAKPKASGFGLPRALRFHQVQ